MKILLIKFRNIGDVLISSVLIANLKAYYPKARIDFAINKESKPILEDNPNINSLIIYDREAIKSKSFLDRLKAEYEIIKNIRLNQYDLTINLTEGDRGHLYSLFSGSSTKMGVRNKKNFFSKINIFDHYLSSDWDLHAVMKDLNFITQLGKKIINESLEIYWDSNTEKEINKKIKGLKLKKFVVVHPVSRWLFKCWDNERMAKAIDYLFYVKGLNVVITSSNDKSEIDRVLKILKLCKSTPCDLSGKLNLKELSYLISKSSMFFGIDTAPMHIAAACKVPVVAIFGASFPSIWGPWNNSKNLFINKNGVQFNGLHYVISHMNHEIYYDKGIKTSRGMTNISLDIVIEVLKKIQV